MIEECIELANAIEITRGNVAEFKAKIKKLMINSLNYNQEILNYGTKSYFAQAIHIWHKHDASVDTWLLPCLTNVKYTLMFISERPMIHGVDDLVSDLTYLQLSAEIEQLI